MEKTLNIIFFSFFLLVTVTSADILQNQDFGLPPSNWNPNSTLLTLDENSTIPGWTFEGNVQYVTAGVNFSLPQNSARRAMLLGQDGKITQTFTASGDQSQYILTFVLARGVQNNCTFNSSLVISAPDITAEFSLTNTNKSVSWEVYGQRLGSWGGGESVNLVIQSRATETDQNTTCWPVVGALELIAIESANQDKDNLLLNGDFELGPAFPEFPNDGVLLNPEPSLIESALPQWTIVGTVKYINVKNHFIPERNAAVEIVSRFPAGIQTAKQLDRGSNYKLEFLLGDSNDSCIGDFIVGVGAGSTVQNFTIQSDGNGSASKYSLAFNAAGEGPTPISFQSYASTQREDGVLCGPVVDWVVLRASGVPTLTVNCVLLVSLLFVAIVRLGELV